MTVPTTTHMAPDQDWPHEGWADAWAGFLRAHHGQAASTKTDRKSAVRGFAIWAAERDITDPAEVSADDMQDYLNIQQDVRKGSGSIATYKKLKGFFRWYAGKYRDCHECANRDLYPSHSCSLTPMHGVSRPKLSEHPYRETHVLTDDEWDALLKAAGTTRPRKTPEAARNETLRAARDTALVWVAGDSGLRRHELWDLAVGDIDMSAGANRGAVVTVRLGKNRRGRISVISADGRRAVKRYLALRVKAGETVTDNSPLWISRQGGGQLSYEQLGKLFVKLGDLAGIKGLHPHSLRHLFADRCYRNNLPADAMKTLGGWKGRIPETYGKAAAEDRAMIAGLAMYEGTRRR